MFDNTRNENIYISHERIGILRVTESYLFFPSIISRYRRIEYANE